MYTLQLLINCACAHDACIVLKSLFYSFSDGYYNIFECSITQSSAHGSAMVLDLETPKCCVLRDVARSSSRDKSLAIDL